MAKISKFYFQKAQYLVGDDQGQEILLGVDYRSNSFVLGGTASGGLRRKAAKIGRDLLRRKYNINFADKFSLY